MSHNVNAIIFNDNLKEFWAYVELTYYKQMESVCNFQNLFRSRPLELLINRKKIIILVAETLPIVTYEL